MITMFKIGDTVRCIDGLNFEYYTGPKFKPHTGCTMVVDDITFDGRYINGWDIDKFELYQPEWDD